MDDVTGDWFTYRQAGALLNVSAAAVRQRAKRGRWQRTLGNDKRTRILLPEDWKNTIRPADRPPRKPVVVEKAPAKRVIEALKSHVETLKSHVEILNAHIGTLTTQLEASEARVEKQASEFAARETRLAADLSVEQILAQQMSTRVDKMTTDLAVEKARRTKLEHELEAVSRRWWKPR